MAKSKRFVSQAALEALVRFGPEIAGLQELQRQATNTFGLGVKQAGATATATRQAIREARPQLAHAYDDAGLAQASVAHTLIGNDLAGLTGPGADRFKAAGSLEAAGAADRLSAAKTQALGDLADRSVRAEEGRGFAVNQAKSQFVDALTSILNRKQALRREKGAFQAATVGQLQDKSDERAFTSTQKELDRTNARDIAAGHDAVSLENSRRSHNKNGSGTRRLPGGAKLQSQAAHNELVTKINDARDRTQGFVKNALKTGKNRSWIDAQLRDGIPGYAVHDPKTGKLQIDPSGAPVTQPGLKPVSALERGIILDVLIDGHVSRRHVDALHRAGFSVEDLGLPRRPAAGGRSPISPGTAHQAGSIAATILHGLGIGG